MSISDEKLDDIGNTFEKWLSDPNGDLKYAAKTGLELIAEVRELREHNNVMRQNTLKAMGETDMGYGWGWIELELPAIVAEVRRLRVERNKWKNMSNEWKQEAYWQKKLFNAWKRLEKDSGELAAIIRGIAEGTAPETLESMLKGGEDG